MISSDYILALAASTGLDLEELGLTIDSDLEEVIDTVVLALFVAELEESLGIEIDALESDLDGVLEEVLAAIFEELGVEEGALDDQDREELQNTLDELDQLPAQVEMELEDLVAEIRELKFTRSALEILAPSEAFVLPSGRTAVEEASWGQLKNRRFR